MATTIKAAAKRKFPLGRTVITPNALATLDHVEVIQSLRRHASGDWGEACPQDATLNDQALEHGDRLLSVFRSGEVKFWIITEADRSSTTVLMPEDY